MKKSFTLITLCILTSFATFAQQDTDNTDFFKTLFGVEKIEIVKDFIKVDKANEAAFWAIYKEYELDRKELRSERLDLINDYAENYSDLSDDKIADLTKRSFKQNKASSKNIEKYFKKLKKAGGIRAAAQFLQIENYFQSLSKATVYENIPFIGELEIIE